MNSNIRTSVLGLVAAIGGVLLAWSPTAYPWIATLGGLLIALGGGLGLHLAADARSYTPGDGQPQANGSGAVPVAPRAASAAARIASGVGSMLGGMAIGVLMVGVVLALPGCTAAQGQAAKTITDTAVHALAPIACNEFSNVVSGGTTVAQLCTDAAKAAADELLARQKSGLAGAAACGVHETIVDAHGAVVGWACSSLAGPVASAIGGSVVSP